MIWGCDRRVSRSHGAAGPPAATPFGRTWRLWGAAGTAGGYRRTQSEPDGPHSRYGGTDGISLGTAITISGAAASPNMGYHSSPLVTFMMTFFNARLGWWLGNPGPAGDDTFYLSSPRFTIRPILAEAFGLHGLEGGEILPVPCRSLHGEFEKSCTRRPQLLQQARRRRGIGILQQLRLQIDRILVVAAFASAVDQLRHRPHISNDLRSPVGDRHRLAAPGQPELRITAALRGLRVIPRRLLPRAFIQRRAVLEQDPLVAAVRELQLGGQFRERAGYVELLEFPGQLVQTRALVKAIQIFKELRQRRHGCRRKGAR